MAPFITHFLVAEKFWLNFADAQQYDYGQFCFGCVAPDVDKISAGLTQRDTHFYDRSDDYEFMAHERSRRFLAQQQYFLGQPHATLSPLEQSFSLGYLCHLCVDEVSKNLWRSDTWQKFTAVNPLTAFAALDESARPQLHHYKQLRQAICQLTPLPVVTLIPLADLVRFHQGICQFVRATNIEDEFLAVLELFDWPPEKRTLLIQKFYEEIKRARRQVNLFRLDTLVAQSLARTHERFAELGVH